MTKETIYCAIAFVYLYAAIKEYRKYRRHHRYDWQEIGCYLSNAILHGLLTYVSSQAH